MERTSRESSWRNQHDLNLSRPPGTKYVSASRNSSRSPVARWAPWKQDQDFPVHPAGFGAEVTTRAPSRTATAAVLSVDSSSTTRTSSGSVDDSLMERSEERRVG